MPTVICEAPEWQATNESGRRSTPVTVQWLGHPPVLHGTVSLATVSEISEALASLAQGPCADYACNLTQSTAQRLSLATVRGLGISSGLLECLADIAASIALAMSARLLGGCLPLPEEGLGIFRSLIGKDVDAALSMYRDTKLVRVDVRRREMTGVLFEALLRAHGETQTRLFEFLSAEADPESVLTHAVEEYRKHGYETRLSTTSDLLARMGKRAWTTLADLPARYPDVCEFFVETIAGMEAIAVRARTEVLINVARASDESARRRILAVVDEFPGEDARKLLKILTEDSDEGIREMAIEELEELEK